MKPIQISLRGSDLARLSPLGRQLMSEARQVPRWRGAPSVERIRTTLHVGQAKAAELAAALVAEDASATTPENPEPTVTEEVA